MARSSTKKAQPKRPGRFKRWVDRVVLGALMSIAIAIADRRLRKILGGEAEPKPKDRDRVVEIN